MTVVVERISSIERFRALESDWRTLEARAAPGMPFATYDWVTAWWSHFRERRFGVRDRLDMRVLRSLDGAPLGIAPLITTFRPGFGPLGIRQLHYVGPDPNITELRGPLAPSTGIRESYDALLDDLEAMSSSWDLLTLSDVPAGTGVEAAVLARFGMIAAVREISSFHLPLASSWNEFKTRLGRNIKESIRHCYNAPKRDGIDLQFEVVSERDAVLPALDEFFRLHEARAASHTSVRHPNVFESSAAKRFLCDVCERFAARGAFRLFRIRIRGTTVAARLGFVLGDCLYLYYSGYDPAFGRYSVMTTAVAEALRYAIEHGLRTVNLSTGRDTSKLRWSPVETVHREITVVSPSFRGWLSYRATVQARAWLGERPTDGARVRSGGLGRRIAMALGRRTD
jgi:CelD/BcsL family acetyltransferase involved in cellulose biosynthesis